MYGVGIKSTVIGGSSDLLQDQLLIQLEAARSYPGSGDTWFNSAIDRTVPSGTLVNALFDDRGYFNLDGTGDWIRVNHNALLSITTSGSKTFQIWVKFDSIAENTVLLGKLTSGAGNLLTLGASGSLKTFTSGSTIARTVSSDAGKVTTGTWYLITYVAKIEGIAEHIEDLDDYMVFPYVQADSIKIFVNDTEALITQHGDDTYSESNTLFLGSTGGAEGVTGVDLDGQLGAFYLYNKALTPAEIAANFTSTKGRFGL